MPLIPAPGRQSKRLSAAKMLKHHVKAIERPWHVCFTSISQPHLSKTSLADYIFVTITGFSLPRSDSFSTTL